MTHSVKHFEFWSEDPQGLSDFYQAVFDWPIQHIPEMDYWLVPPAGDGIGGGIMKPKQGPWPGNMSFYITVEELETYRQKITAAGGTIIVPEQDVPGVGKFCLFSDPDGRVLGIWVELGKT